MQISGFTQKSIRDYPEVNKGPNSLPGSRYSLSGRVNEQLDVKNDKKGAPTL